MPYLLLGVALLLGLWLAGRWYVHTTPATAARVVRWGAIFLVVAIILLVAATRQFAWLSFALALLLPWYLRARSIARTARNWQRMSGGAQAQAGQSSQIETRYLRMYLDHVSGDMNGDVVLGRFSGRKLGDMSLDDLLDLMGEGANDEQTVQVLSAYLERTYPDDWRGRAQQRGTRTEGSAGGAGSMTRQEAYEILDLEEGATADDIKEAHHRLMGQLHPDRGGSTYLATKINQAKDYLLGQ